MAEAANTFFTGFPKLLPRRLLRAFIARAPDARATLLVREKHLEEAKTFLASLLPSESLRVKVLVGDVANLHLGLSTSEYRDAAASITDVVHAAEWSQLSADRAQMVRVNIEGTRGVLELADDCRNLRRFTHLSTVFVSGDRTGVVAEDELAAGQTFRNAYEETRFEAELLVRRAMSELPCTVLRPSIMVGDSRTGEIDRFDGPYAIAIVLVTSPVSVPVPLPGNGVAPLNVVPINWVAAVAERLHFDARAVGRTFHLVDPNPPSSRRVWELVAQRTGKRLPRMSLGYKLTDTLLKLPGLERLTRDQRMAIAYVNHLSFFSSRNTLELLDGTGLNCPHIESYLDVLIEYVKGEFRRKRES